MPRWLVRAPGRVNWIGEHTDTSEGLVLPFAIDRGLRIAAAPRVDGRCRVWSAAFGRRGEEVEFGCDALHRRSHWVDYVQAVVFALQESGHRIPGFDLAITGDLPPGAGLSSSAALGVGVCMALCELAGIELDATACARIVHRGESVFVGTPCGILDPFAVALGRRDCALRIDCRSEQVEWIPIPTARLRILIANSGRNHQLAFDADGTQSYARRVEETRAAFEALRHAGVAHSSHHTLRDFDVTDLPLLEGVLDDRLQRRARHVITENRRVDLFCAALRGDPETVDLERLGELLSEGQQSLRDDFEVSTRELDYLCSQADSMAGVYGSRLTGAGFGGSTLHLIDPDVCDAVAIDLARGFESEFGRPLPLDVVTPAAGASLETC